MLSRTNTFLSLINHKLDTVVPSLLLGNQYNYPNDQLTVAQQYGIQLSQAWDSGFRMYAPSPAFGDHGFTAISLTCRDSTTPPAIPPTVPLETYPNACPGTYDKGGGYGAAPASASGSGGLPLPALPAAPSSGPSTPADTPVSVSAQQQLLQYLLGQ